MPFLFTCPHCGARTQSEERYIGQTGPCHDCGKQVTVHPPDLQSRQKLTGAGNSSVSLMVIVLVGAVIVSISVLGVLVVVMAPRLNVIKNARNITASENQLKAIGVALYSYHDRYGSFPPAYTVDEKGKRLHSWRVLILPFFGPEEAAAYRQFDLSKPWNDPTNLSAAMLMPAVYSSPTDPNGTNSGITSYVVVSGPGTMFPGSTPLKIKDISDPLNHVLMVVESPASSIAWNEPKDLDINRMKFELNTYDPAEMSGDHAGGVLILRADGSPFFLDESTPPTSIQGITTIAGDETPPPGM